MSNTITITKEERNALIRMVCKRIDDCNAIKATRTTKEHKVDAAAEAEAMTALLTKIAAVKVI